MAEFRYGDLTWPEMRAAVARQPVVLLPFGTVEDHGLHLPLDTGSGTFFLKLLCPGADLPLTYLP